MTTVQMREGESSKGAIASITVAQALPLLLSFAFVSIGLFSLAPVLPEIRDAFVADPHVGMLIQITGAIAGFTFAVASLGVGTVVERFGYRNVYICSLTLFSLAGLSGAVLHNLVLIAVTRAIVGIATAGAVNAGLVGIGLVVPEHLRMRFLGIVSLCSSMVGIISTPLVGLLGRIEWRAAFAPHVLGLLIFPLIFALPNIVGKKTDSSRATKGRGLGAVLMIATVAVGMGIFLVIVYPPLYLSDGGITDTRLLAIPPAMAAVGTLLGAGIFELVNRRLNIAGTFALSIGALGAGLIVAGLSTSLITIAAGVAIAAVGVGMYSPNLNAAAIAGSPGNPAHSLGLANALFLGSMVLFPFVSTSITRMLGGGSVFFVFAAAMFVFAVVTPLAVIQRRRHPSGSTF
jgi:MFS family permease